jgi:hypothetical protein
VPPLRGYAYVAGGTRMHVTPTLTDPGFALGVVRPGDPIWQARSYGLLKILGEEARALRVETVADDEVPCGVNTALGGPFRLTGWIAKDTPLAPVTTREVVVQFPDRSSARIGPGARVDADPAADGRVTLHAGALRVSLQLPSDALGRAFVPGEPLATGEDDWDRNASRDLLCGGQRVSGLRAATTLHAFAEDLVEARTACAALVLSAVPGTGIDDDMGLDSIGSIGLSHGMPCSGAEARQGDHLRVPSGSSATWPDGLPAGSALAEVSFACRAPHQADDAKRVCQTVGGMGADGQPTLCFARNEVSLRERTR